MRTCLALLLLPAAAAASPVPDPGSPADLARTLRGFILESLPPILYEDSDHWGEQKLVTRGIEWKGKGVLPKAQKSYKNHGVWRKVRVTPVTPHATLQVDIRDVRQVTPDTRHFTTFVGTDARVEVEQQNWRAGVRTLSSSFKARFRILLHLHCEVTTRLEKSKGPLPDLVFRVRVLRAEVRYDSFVTEHVAGLGGEMAEWIGDAGLGLMNRIRPSLENRMLEKAGAAVVRSADTKEVRVGLGKLFSK
jgi:hypothetical protein